MYPEQISRIFFGILLFLLFSLSSGTAVMGQEGERSGDTTAIAEGGSDSTAAEKKEEKSWLDRLGVRDVRISAAHYFSPPGTNSLHAESPPYLEYLREERSQWGTEHYSILDNPLYHGAAWVDAEAELWPHPGFYLIVGLTAENRGISYGIGNTRNSIVLPRYRIGVDTGFSFFNRQLRVRLAVGDTRNARIDEGLFFAHDDIQGGSLSLDWWKLRFSYTKVGDAFAGLGLNIDDADYSRLELRDIPLLGGWHGGIGIGSFIHAPAGPALQDYVEGSPRWNLLQMAGLMNAGYTMSAHISPADTLFRFYAQAAVRNAETPDYTMNRTAFVAGLSGKVEWKRFRFEGRGEYRYYGGLFNAGYRNTDVYYRDPNREQTWGNSIGPHLYQLSWFEHPFSQWPVFAEYQDLKDVTGWTLYAKGKWYFYDRFLVRGMLDLNYIVPEKVDPFLYPFFDIGLGWEPFDKFSVLFSITNKGMNLDKHYPTFYLFDESVGSIAFRWNVE